MKEKVLYTRDKDGRLGEALDRELARRREAGIPSDDRSSLIRETLWQAVRSWEDPRRGKMLR